MSIPKKLHYIWVGKKPIPSTIKKIMENNANILGGKWDIKVWTEKDFDFMESNEFIKYWYKRKQWAFVSDYLRAYVVNKHGGVYCDTDVSFTKSIDELLETKYLASRSGIVYNTMSIFGSVKNSKILDTYLKVISDSNLIKKPPKIMSTHIHSYAITKYFNPTYENKDYFFKNELTILTEDKLQLDMKNGKNFTIHQHHDNWTGKSNLKISKYYWQKIRTFKKINDEFIKKRLRKREKVFKKITKLLNK